jgi:hypothetical protein
MITTYGQKNYGKNKLVAYLVYCVCFYYMPKLIGYLNPKTHHFLKEGMLQNARLTELTLME